MREIVREATRYGILVYTCIHCHCTRRVPYLEKLRQTFMAHKMADEERAPEASALARGSGQRRYLTERKKVLAAASGIIRAAP